MEENQINLLIFGAPGSGKGTQARLLAEHCRGLSVISVGDLLRKEVSARTDVGIEVEKVMQSGALVSDVLVCEMMLRQLGCIGGRGFLLDGFPRNLPQARFLSGALQLFSSDIDLVLKLEVEVNTLKKRLGGRLVCKRCGRISNVGFKEDVCVECGSGDYVRRGDDMEDVISQRLKEYESVVKELVIYYGSKVVTIDGNRSVHEVFVDVKSKVECLNN